MFDCSDFRWVFLMQVMCPRFLKHEYPFSICYQLVVVSSCILWTASSIIDWKVIVFTRSSCFSVDFLSSRFRFQFRRVSEISISSNILQFERRIFDFCKTYLPHKNNCAHFEQSPNCENWTKPQILLGIPSDHSDLLFYRLLVYLLCLNKLNRLSCFVIWI
jgi:hypothetical protein